ncbi:hypothetical protein J6590_093905 [Homalodisca vitripennis]|nr:hypothetical protein J6590_093905 [Homalodisca vitripennis]
MSSSCSRCEGRPVFPPLTRSEPDRTYTMWERPQSGQAVVWLEYVTRLYNGKTMLLAFETELGISFFRSMQTTRHTKYTDFLTVCHSTHNVYLLLESHLFDTDSSLSIIKNQPLDTESPFDIIKSQPLRKFTSQVLVNQSNQKINLFLRVN